MEVSLNGGTPNGWVIREIPIKMDENWGYPYFRKPPRGRAALPLASSSSFFARLVRANKSNFTMVWCGIMVYNRLYIPIISYYIMYIIDFITPKTMVYGI